MIRQIKNIKIVKWFYSSRRWIFILTAAVFITLTLAVWRERDILLSYQWKLNFGSLILSIILHSLALGSMFLAWHFIISRFTGAVKWGQNFRIFSISTLARRIPLPIWYVGSRLVLYQPHQVSKTFVLTATILEIALITITGIILFLWLLPWLSFEQPGSWWLPTLVTICLGFALILRPQILIDILNKLLIWKKRPVISISVPRINILVWSLLYLSTWIFDGLGLFFAINSITSQNIQVIDIMGVSTISALIAIISLTLPSGFGLKEISMATLLSFWIPLSAGIVISIFYRFLQTIIESIWAFIGQYSR